MNIKKMGVFAANRLTCLALICSSFSHLMASLNQQALVQKKLYRSSAKKIAPKTAKKDTEKAEYQNLSYINQKFHDFANTLFFL